MDKTEDLQEAIRRLSPFMPRIESYFESESKKYIQYYEKDTSNLGRILKCHLIIEQYMDKYIEANNRILNIDELKLSFLQKAYILPKSGESISLLRPGILSINKIRNKFSHNIDATVTMNDVSNLKGIVLASHPLMKFDNPIDIIEAFSAIVCTWLMVTPDDIRTAFKMAFNTNNNNGESNDIGE